jgi:hypothetical protein
MPWIACHPEPYLALQDSWRQAENGKQSAITQAPEIMHQ